MKKLAQPMSPRTQGFMGAPSMDDQERLFEDGFNQMAYNTFIGKFPDLVDKIITFKILETDTDNGAAVGVFVLQHDNDVIYVPVILADNQIKPLDMFYHKGLNVFLPLNNEWLQEVSQLTLDEMGETVTPPKTLRRDVDTRHLMIPPTTGRYAYAGVQGLDIEGDLLQMFNKLQQKTASSATSCETPKFTTYLKVASNEVKEAFANVLLEHPRLAAKVANLCGLDELCTALTKHASVTTTTGGALFIATKDTPSTMFQEVFGKRAPEAFQGVTQKGYHAQDDRKNLKIAVLLQTPQRLTTPQHSGFYKIFLRNGTTEDALIIHNGRDTHPADCSPEYRPHNRRHARTGSMNWGEHNKTFTVIHPDGSWCETHHLVAEPIYSSKSDLYKQLMNETGGSTPKTGDRGVFIKKLGQTFIGTLPFTIKTISTDKDGVRRITLDDFHGTQLITDKKAARYGLHRPKSGHIMYIPPDAQFIRLNKTEIEPEKFPLRNPSDVLKCFESNFDAMGAGHLAVKNAGANQVSLNGQPPLGAVEAMKTAALSHDIHFSEAEQLVKLALASPWAHVKARIIGNQQLEKLAQGPMMGPPTMDPNMVPPGVDPNAVAPGAMPMGAPPAPQPPMPSPLDMAVGEANTQMQQQMADLQMQQSALMDKAQTIAQIQQRAQEIATGGGPAIAQGAPPMPMPGQAGSGQAPQGAVGAVPPQQQSPSMPGPAANNPMQAPMGAMMATESPSSTEIQQQINPQFLEQAADLQDGDAFNAAALASMAHVPNFRNMVVDYVPTLERALDNLGRVLISMWMQEGELKGKIGGDNYADIEDNSRAVFEGLGKLVLQLNRNATILSPGGEATN